MDYSKVVDYLKNEHGSFVEKYRLYIEKNVTEKHLERENTYARLTLLGKAFLSAGVIVKYEEVTISSSDRNMAFYTQYGDVFYFLNGSDVVVFMSAKSSIIDAYKNISLLSFAAEEDRVVMKNILSEDFDWFAAAKQILEVIQRTAYRKTEALNDYICQLFVKSDSN